MHSGVGNFVRTTECAFFHKRSRTLLVTDACIYINDEVRTLIQRGYRGHTDILKTSMNMQLPFKSGWMVL